MIERLEYITSERAFSDLWIEYECPDEINGVQECYLFLSKLMERTEGYFVLDHFSGASYDHIQRIEMKEEKLFIYWKDFKINPIDVEEQELKELLSWMYDNSTFIYTVCDIRKLKFFESNGHLFILFMPNVISVDETKKVLSVQNLKNEEVEIDEEYNSFETKIRFVLEGKIHDCIISKFPFYSFLIQPKENVSVTVYSTELLKENTLIEAQNRLNRALETLSFTEGLEYDQINSAGSLARTVLESIIKYYCLYSKYSLPNESYGHNMLGNLRKHLQKNNDEIAKLLSNELIKKANQFSHDTGKTHTIKEVEELIEAINDIILSIHDKIKYRSRARKQR
ncbi:hypothetical protein [Paenibacillus apis]|uniref:HEPN domain-containing protein n=1 Tax=Paenibacillus apis TaxID=1792174 RepID=A0A920CM28_9BACL|nr:hypothetical protein [Paenibacillus apis]GIO42279.1 hypothetical protein J41TS4_20370 [Paenibacillus apis]